MSQSRGGDNMVERLCPKCGEKIKNLGSHMRACDGGGSE